MKQDIIPDILNSRNERVILELPNYTYCHSSQTKEESQSFFIGRKSLLLKLKNLISTSASKTGVYLVTGNRGVGKSRLVEEVIKETTLEKYSISNYFSFLFVILVLTLGVQYISNHEWIQTFIPFSIENFTLSDKTSQSWFWKFLSFVFNRIKIQDENSPASIDGMLFFLSLLRLLFALILFFIIGYYSNLRKTRDYVYPRNRKESNPKKNPKENNDQDYPKENWKVKKEDFIENYPKNSKWDKNREHYYKLIIDFILILIASLKDCLILPNKSNPFLRTQNVLKLVLILIVIDFFAELTDFTQFHLLLMYLSAVLGYFYIVHSKQIFIKVLLEGDRIIKDERFKNNLSTLNKALNRNLKCATFVVVALSIAITGYSIHMSSIENTVFISFLILLIGFFLILCIVFGVHYYLVYEDLKKERKTNIVYLFMIYLHTQIGPLFNSIDHYIKNSSHVYLKINFGHDVLNEYDILRLITRTLTTEYRFFRKSIMHLLLWRFLALTLLLSCTYLFYEKIYIPDIQPSIENYSFYYNSSQHYFSFEIEHEKHSFIINFFNSTDCIYIDKAINRIYYYILNVQNYFWEKKGNAQNDVFYSINYYFPPINYAWLIILFLFYLLYCLLLRFNFFTSHYTVRKQLMRLNENLTYSVEREYSIGSGVKKDNFMTNIGIKKKKTRIIADAREIEKELQDILKNIQKIPTFLGRPDFVIVFDELDKVSPEAPIQVQEGEAKNKEKLFSSNSTTERQAVILKLLSNMKYFLSTAYAKFIFIAGREMYDMYLADIADRNNYFGSIFNDVFFVPSLLTDVKSNKRQYDITALVEEYICRNLIPEDYPTSIYNLKEYIKYLDSLIYYENKDYKPQIEMKKQKIIATLQQFIIYLAHTSKGSPKKIVQVFESFIECYDSNDLKNKYLIIKRFRNSVLFLNFDYYAQYTIGMTSYLMTPVFKRMSDANIQENSDKLFVSTLHFVDYMMKFHGHNFSWRSIDISPELIEINRSPVLKAIVNDIVTLFEQIHFHKPIISLFEFKFDALLVQEIFFLSKMDERFSAQFNFSLDESLILKDYYKKLLKDKQKEYEKYKTYGENYVSSIASLHIVLGDLHFLDDELDVAALYYKDGQYLLQKQLVKDIEKGNLEIFYLFIRNQLKLAYLYEKRKQPDFAYLLYGNLTSLLVQYRDINLDEKGISIRKDGDEFIMVKNRGNEPMNPYNKNFETAEFSHNTDSYIYENEKNRDESEIQKNKARFRSMHFEQLSPLTQQIMFKNMTFEGLQLIYLPLLAKLQILEKCSMVGILMKDIQLIEQEFEFITRTINLSEVKILAADFYSKIGDILFYKNKVFSTSESPDTINRNIDKKIKIDISHYPCLYYQKALIAMVAKSGDKKEKDKLKVKSILNIIEENIGYIESKLSVRYRTMIAKVFSNLGDTYFQAQEGQCKFCEFKKTDRDDNSSFILATPENISKEDVNKPDTAKKNYKFWDEWEMFMISKGNYDNSLSDFINKIYNKDDSKLTNIEYALLTYSLSMKFYMKANRNKHYAFQIEKILNGLKYCLRYKIHTEEIKKFFKWNYNTKRYENLDKLVSKAIHSLYVAYDNINMHEIAKRKADFDKLNKTFHERNIPLHYIQVDSEISRIRIIAKELELELDKIEKPNRKDKTNVVVGPNGTVDNDNRMVEIVKKYYGNNITSPYQVNSSVTARVHRLRMKAILNHEACKIMKNEFLKVFMDRIRTYNQEMTDVQRAEMEKKFNDNLYLQFVTIIIYGLENKDDLWEKSKTKMIFDNQIKDTEKKTFFSVLEMLIADSIFCLEEILRLIKTAGDSYLFNHSFFAAIYYRLSIWTTKYEILKNIGIYIEQEKKCKNVLPEKFRKALDYYDETYLNTDDFVSKIEQLLKEMQIDNYMRKFIGIDFKEQLSSHYYREQAIAHYYKTIDTHNGGRAYLNLLEQMYFIKGDYDDVTSHFYVALERFLVNNSNEIQERIKELKEKGALSSVYEMDNYFEKNYNITSQSDN